MGFSKRAAWFILGLVALSTTVLSPRDGKGMKTRSLEREAVRRREEIYAIHLVNRLHLAPDQIDFLLEQVKRARPYLESFEAALPGVYAVEREAFRAFKAEDEANRGFSPQVEQYVARAERMEKALEEKRKQVLGSLARPVYEILTEEQRREVDRYRPVLFDRLGPEGRGAGFWDWRIRTVREALEKAIGLSDGAYRREKKRIVQRMVNVFPPHLLGPVKRALGEGKGRKSRVSRRPPDREGERETREAVIRRLGELTDSLRAKPRKEALAQLDRVVATRIFPSKVRQTEMELREIQRSKTAGPTNTARFLLNPDLAPYLEKLRALARRTAR